MARATALYNGLMRTFASFSTAFLSTILATRSLFHYSSMAAAMTPDRPGVAAFMSALQPELVSRGITDPQAQDRVIAGILTRTTSQQALVLAFDDVFLLLTAFSAVAVLLALFLRDPLVEGQTSSAGALRPARAAS
jgi:hypothetical protein